MWTKWNCLRLSFKRKYLSAYFKPYDFLNVHITIKRFGDQVIVNSSADNYLISTRYSWTILESYFPITFIWISLFICNFMAKILCVIIMPKSKSKSHVANMPSSYSDMQESLTVFASTLHCIHYMCFPMHLVSMYLHSHSLKEGKSKIIITTKPSSLLKWLLS